MANVENDERHKDTPSFKAIRNGLNTLYNITDFNLEKIGEGFFSNVYKATHKETNDVFVIKRLKRKEDNPKRLFLHYRSALHEIELLRLLSNEHVIKLRGVCVENGKLHSMTDYMDRGCLETLVIDKEKVLSWNARINIAFDVARAMRYVHSKAFLHRDLTASNVLLKSVISRGKERLKALVADFGLATKSPLPGTKLPIVGSPFYMSPECLHSQFYDQRTDVFSFGIILIQLILRTDSDPDRIPRTNAYGLDYVEVGKKVKGTQCPLALLADAFYCCQVDPKERPHFSKLSLSLGRLLSSPNHYEIVADQETLATTLQSAHLRKIADKRINSMNSKLPGGHFVNLTAVLVGNVMSKLDTHYGSKLDRNSFDLKFRNKLIPGSVSSDEFLWKSTDEMDSSISDSESSYLRRSYSLPMRKRKTKDEKDNFSETSEDSGVALSKIFNQNIFKKSSQSAERDIILNVIVTTENNVKNLCNLCEERDKAVRQEKIRR